MDPWTGAVIGDGEGVTILLEVSPGSRRGASVTGYNAWRRRVQCAVSAPPRGGKANRDVLELLSDVLSVPASAVTLASGGASREKKVHECRVHQVHRFPDREDKVEDRRLNGSIGPRVHPSLLPASARAPLHL